MNIDRLPDEKGFRILRFLDDKGIVSTPKVITHVTEIDHDDVKTRLRDMERHGLVYQPEPWSEKYKQRGLYEITDLGRRVVSTLSELDDYPDNGEQ